MSLDLFGFTPSQRRNRFLRSVKEVGKAKLCPKLERFMENKALQFIDHPVLKREDWFFAAIELMWYGTPFYDKLKELLLAANGPCQHCGDPLKFDPNNRWDDIYCSEYCADADRPEIEYDDEGDE